MRSFTHVISLGNRCATAYNLRRHFSFGDGHLFDWWITPYPGLLALLDNLSADWLYDPASLEMLPDNRAVRHRPSGIELTHDFPRVGKHAGPVTVDFLDYLDRPKSRAGYLIDKLKGLNCPGERILFVREAAVTSALSERLAALLPLARFEVASIEPVANLGDWRGDPALWDAALASLEARLIGDHKPFSEPGEVQPVLRTTDA
ncbi:hypothetical protein [Brevundimonas sp.]|uniref:hypothetical protein n=1 Tax=Brevundimonas sp. TaxID=1871086 RepID=UPI0025CFE776|nr:hypothetical protein [Brevundimonas sp.]